MLSSHLKLDFDNVLLVPKKTSIHSRRLVNLEREFKFKYSSKKWKGVPLISANMDSVTNIDTYNVLSMRNWLSCFPKYFNKEFKTNGIPEILERQSNYIISCGIKDYDLVNHVILYEDSPPLFICVDVANGYLEDVIRVCNMIRDVYSDCIIIAGNVVTPEGVVDLVEKGRVDIVKVGIGSGALCTTRKVTGVGYPQFSAVLECAETAHELGAHIISDGGIVNPGDICKAFAAGADFVMIGSMLAGHDISPGIKTMVNGEFYKHVYGMSSEHANNKHFGGLKDYKSPEGRSLKIPFKGSLEKTMSYIEGGLRSSCSYLGTRTIEGLKNANYILVHNQYNTSLEKYDTRSM